MIIGTDIVSSTVVAVILSLCIWVSFTIGARLAVARRTETELIDALEAITAAIEVTPGLNAGKIARSLSAALNMHGPTIRSMFTTRHPVVDDDTQSSNLVCQDDDGVLTVSPLGVINMLLLDHGSKYIIVTTWVDDVIQKFDACPVIRGDDGNLSIGSTSKHRPCAVDPRKVEEDDERSPT